jgi:hypothetical protein
VTVKLSGIAVGSIPDGLRRVPGVDKVLVTGEEYRPGIIVRGGTVMAVAGGMPITFDLGAESVLFTGAMVAGEEAAVVLQGLQAVVGGKLDNPAPAMKAGYAAENIKLCMEMMQSMVDAMSEGVAKAAAEIDRLKEYAGGEALDASLSAIGIDPAALDEQKAAMLESAASIKSGASGLKIP